MKNTSFSVVLCLGALASACGDDGKSAQVPTSETGADGTGVGGEDEGPDGAEEGAETESDDAGTSGQTDGSGDDETTGSPFIVEIDMGGNSECDIWSQDCQEGEKCMPWANDGSNSWNATKCTPLDPNPKQAGDACTVEGTGVSGIDDCDVSMMCWNVDPATGMGYCVDFCQGDPQSSSCADPSTLCTIYNDGVLPLCLPACDPLLQDCGNEDLCVGTAEGHGFVCVLDASGMDTGMYGDPCEFVNACDAGLFCATAAAVPGCTASAGCCSPFCDLTLNDNSQCPGAADGQECAAWWTDPAQIPPGYDDVGACLIPQ